MGVLVNNTCCAAARETPAAHSAQPVPAANEEVRNRLQRGMIRLPGGEFLMGTDDPDANPADGEGPVRPVRVAAMRIAATTVTNRRFAAFVKDTGYVTDAERYGWSFVFHLFVPPTVQKTITQAPAAAPWWLPVDGAYWKRPEGPGSAIGDRPEHPAVHVSWNDAQAYCAWSGTRLPSEAEWEYAARGGLVQARYPWGDELTPRGKHRCNIWQGRFPEHNTGDDGFVGTAPAKAFPPNGFGLYQTAGNVWEWCADTFRAPDAEPDAHVMRGGSYLCHDSYCNRYRVAARTSNTADSSSGNVGFRVAAT
ncbi:formylglycine-generating enzyme family protein [Amycolatopsis sp. Poz14]|nr:formylglycine-generating enzyme family protein [Amycolatopsis sp. Poz14]